MSETRAESSSRPARRAGSEPKSGDQAGAAGKPAVREVRRAGAAGGQNYASLVTEMGTTHIADIVVAKIAGMATREIPGVHSMGSGLVRRLGRVRAMVPGQAEESQGVAVEVGEREAAIDLDIVTIYGESIVEISEAVRRNVIDRVETMSGLKVVEVNINVNDIFIEGQEEPPAEEEPRVR